jgi:hypothetical protein
VHATMPSSSYLLNTIDLYSAYMSFIRTDVVDIVSGIFHLPGAHPFSQDTPAARQKIAGLHSTTTLKMKPFSLSVNLSLPSLCMILSKERIPGLQNQRHLRSIPNKLRVIHHHLLSQEPVCLYCTMDIYLRYEENSCD